MPVFFSLLLLCFSFAYTTTSTHLTLQKSHGREKAGNRFFFSCPCLILKSKFCIVTNHLNMFWCCKSVFYQAVNYYHSDRAAGNVNHTVELKLYKFVPFSMSQEDLGLLDWEGRGKACLLFSFFTKLLAPRCLGL